VSEIYKNSKRRAKSAPKRKGHLKTTDLFLRSTHKSLELGDFWERGGGDKFKVTVPKGA